MTSSRGSRVRFVVLDALRPRILDDSGPAPLVATCKAVRKDSGLEIFVAGVVSP